MDRSRGLRIAAVCVTALTSLSLVACKDDDNQTSQPATDSGTFDSAVVSDAGTASNVLPDSAPLPPPPVGPILGGLQFPLDAIPTALVKPYGIDKDFESGIQSGQYRAAVEMGTLDRANLALQYTFWGRSETPLPGDGTGYPVWWTSLHSPVNMLCAVENTGTNKGYILGVIGGQDLPTPSPYPGQEAACGWELVKHPTDDKYAIKSLKFPPSGGKATYVGKVHASGVGAVYHIVLMLGNVAPTNADPIAWFTMNTLTP